MSNTERTCSINGAAHWRYEQRREANPDDPGTPQPVLLIVDGLGAYISWLAEHAVLVAALSERGRV